MIRSVAVARLLGLALALASFAFLTSCGSGAVGGTPTANDPTRITILPAAATAFSGLPTTFVISGGTGSYIVASSNQSIVPVSGAVTGSSLTIVPNPVTANTTVTLTVRDTGTAPTASATVTVIPGTVANNITITPSSTQGGSCAPAVCSGGDALVSTTISQGGVPLPARGVRFDVVTGNFLFVTTDPASGVDTLTNTVTVTSDQAGNAQARIRIPADAPNQTALLQITDLGTGAFQRASFTIAQATGTSPGFFTSPESITFQGANTNTCADSNVQGTVFVFGGAPPYTVSNTSNAFQVDRDSLSSSGASFNVVPVGICVASPGLPIVVRDSSGRTATTLVANIPGTQPVPPLTVAPSTVTLTSCTSSASVIASGGAGSYVGSTGSSSIVFTHSGNTFTISRVPTNSPGATSPAPPSSTTFTVSDGQTSQTVTVNFSGEGAGACPAVHTNPSTVTLTSCAPATVNLSGGSGSGTYVATSNNQSVTVSTSGSTLTIHRTSPSASFTPPATVTITSGSATGTVTVNATGDPGPPPTGGIGACP